MRDPITGYISSEELVEWTVFVEGAEWCLGKIEYPENRDGDDPCLGECFRHQIRVHQDAIVFYFVMEDDGFHVAGVEIVVSPDPSHAVSPRVIMSEYETICPTAQIKEALGKGALRRLAALLNS